MESDQIVKAFLDQENRVSLFPTKKRKQLHVLGYLASKFQPGIRYTEREVNALLEQWHTFHDPCSLRRELYNHHFLNRLPDGSAYWLEDPQPETE